MFIQTEDLVKAYKERNAVNGVSIRVDQGQIVGLLGPNGAGKTTTFYMIVGIERPTSGKTTSWPCWRRRSSARRSSMKKWKP